MSEEMKKAKELVDKFTSEINDFTGGTESHTTIFAKRLAHICVEELLTAHWDYGYKTFWTNVNEQINAI